MLAAPQQATLLSSARPREFYCWLHGWNNTHNGSDCKVMGTNTEYTFTMRNATGPDNTGGNPKVGVPVHLNRPRPHHRPRLSFFCPLPSCVLCLSSPSLFPTPNPSPTSSLDSRDKVLALPHEATRAGPAIHATHLLEQAEGSISCPKEDSRAGLAPITSLSHEQSEGHTSLPHEDTRASATKFIASHTLPKSEGNNLRVRDIAVFISHLSTSHRSLSFCFPQPL
jgi:hypothetical protein